MLTRTRHTCRPHYPVAWFGSAYIQNVTGFAHLLKSVVCPHRCFQVRLHPARRPAFAIDAVVGRLRHLLKARQRDDATRA